MIGKLRYKIWKWGIAVCVVLSLVGWWCFHSPKPPAFKGPAMVLIPAGDFQMGDHSTRDSHWLPVHTVRVSTFLIGNCEVTKAEWDDVRDWGKAHGFTDLAEGGGKAPNHPVQTISWYDVVKWCNARSLKENYKPCYTVASGIYKAGEDDAVACDWSADGYRLPSEAEWEKAARGGLVGKDYPWGDSINHSYANYCDSTAYSTFWNGLLNKAFPGRTRSPGTLGHHPAFKMGHEPYSSPVASFPANGYGLHDMIGNVWEGCWDRYGDYSSGYQVDPRGAGLGAHRVVRGGCWDSNADNSNVVARGRTHPGSPNNRTGFRVARSSVPPTFGRVWGQ